MQDVLKIYEKNINIDNIRKEIELLKKDLKNQKTVDNLKKLFSFIDLTTLNTIDSEKTGITLCNKVNDLQKTYRGIPDIAAICVYPILTETVKRHLKNKNIKIASVSAGFPSSQTFPAIKVVESRMVVEKGADEIDIVLSVGKFIEKKYKDVYMEIAIIKEAVPGTHVKVILETGELPDFDSIRTASIISMEAGADFIKTSTGKTGVSATPEAVYIMTQAIGDYYNITKRKVGIKPAGGISSTDDALLYMAIIKKNLGEEWLNNKLFRIGASRLANSLLQDIVRLETNKEVNIQYF